MIGKEQIEDELSSKRGFALWDENDEIADEVHTRKNLKREIERCI